MNLPASHNLEHPPQRSSPTAPDSGERRRRRLGPQSPVAAIRPQQPARPPSLPLQDAPTETYLAQQGQNLVSLHRRLSEVITAAASLFHRWPLRPFIPQTRPDARPPQEPHPERERSHDFPFGQGGLPRMGAAVPVTVVPPPPPYTPAPSYHSEDFSMALNNQSLSN